MLLLRCMRFLRPFRLLDRYNLATLSVCVFLLLFSFMVSHGSVLFVICIDGMYAL